MRMITLGDRFDPRDFYDRLKKSTVEFIVIFSGILLSFYVEQSWTVSEGRADRIQNLESLTAEVSEMITYTEGRIDDMKWVSETFKSNTRDGMMMIHLFLLNLLKMLMEMGNWVLQMMIFMYLCLYI